MTTPVTPAKRPSRRWYGVAAVLAAVAVTIGIVLAVWIARAITGYDITTFEAGQEQSIELGDHGEAIWVAPDGAVADCDSVDEQGQPSLFDGTATVTMSDGAHNWTRVGIVKGAPGSRHTVTCEGDGGAQVFGHAPNPQIAKYVILGAGGGLIAGLSALAAFVIVLVVAIKRNRKPSPPPVAAGPA